MTPVRASGCAFILILALIFPLAAPASADTYQWTNERGQLGFADSLDKVPPQFRKSAKRIKKPGTVQKAPAPQDSSIADPGASTGDPHADWRDRISRTRMELEGLRAQREAAQEEYNTLLHRRNKKSYPLEADVEAKVSAQISRLDQQIRDKEHELSVTIPEEARQAGVPPSVLSP